MQIEMILYRYLHIVNDDGKNVLQCLYICHMRGV